MSTLPASGVRPKSSGPKSISAARLKPATKSYRVDENYIQAKGQDRYLHRALDSTGQTIDFLLTAKRDAASAQRFFRKVFANPANVQLPHQRG
jgi:transposase-like protein